VPRESVKPQQRNIPTEANGDVFNSSFDFAHLNRLADFMRIHAHRFMRDFDCAGHSVAVYDNLNRGIAIRQEVILLCEQLRERLGCCSRVGASDYQLGQYSPGAVNQADNVIAHDRT
jgi:hypothetical protein